MPLFSRQIKACQQLRAWLFAENGFYAKLICAAVVGVVAIVGLTAFMIFLAVREHSYDQLRSHTLDTLRTANKVENDLANLETSHRGYLLTGQQLYIEPFERRTALIETRLNQLMALVYSDPEQRKRVGQAQESINQWLQQVAAPEIQQRMNLKPQAVISSTALGRSLIDSVRKTLQSVQDQAQAKLDMQTDGHQSNISFEVLISTPRLEGVVSDMEKAGWGYLLTGEKIFLDTYNQELDQFYTYHGHLAMLEAGNKSQLATLAKIRAGLEHWEIQIMQPELAAKQEGRDVTALVIHDRSTAAMDAVRMAIGEFEQNETAVYDKVDFQTQIQRILRTGSLALLCVFATVFLIGSSWYSFRAYRKHLGKIESAEAQTRSIIATVVDGLITMTEQGIILSVNPAAEKMFGYKTSEMVGQSITKIIPQRLFVHDMSNLGRGTMMAVGQRQNYFSFPIEMSLSEMSVNGRRNFVALIRDVTERKRSEETLRHIGMGVSAATGKEFVRSLVKQLSKALQSDFAFVVETVKKGDESVCSLIIAEHGNIRSKINYKLAATPFEEVLKKGYRAYADDVRDRFPNDEVLQELEVKSFVAMPLVDHKGRAVGVMGVLDRKPMENIEIAESTLQIFAARAAAEIERQRYEDDLGAEKERLAVTLRSIGDGFITTDVEGRVLMLNNVAEKLTGWEGDTAIGQALIDVFNICNERTHKPVRNAVERIIETGSAVGMANHSLIVSRAGTERLIETSASPIRDKMNKKIGVVLVFRDITEKSHAEEERRKAEKLESLGIAAGGIAHDFNNLLTGIIGNLSLALITADPGDEIVERLNTAKKASLRAQELAQQLLTFAKGGAPVKKTSSIGQLITDTVNFSVTATNVQKNVIISPSLWPVDIDSGQISQVITNVTVNAEQAMPAGGMLRVQCENYKLENEDSNIPSLLPGRYVKISIQDEGIGIPAEYLKKIFDPYFTTKPKGSGLGLATAYSIIKNHDGIITVDSKAGAGSAFCIYLPASEKEVGYDKAAALAPKSGSGKILVMDDEEVICELVIHTLTPLGYTVTESRDGLACIRLYEEAMKAGKPFDAVIMDLTIPGGMGGKEAVKQLIRLDPSVKAIVSSGYATDPVMSRHREYGFCAMLAKPYEIADLARIVHEVVGTKSDSLIFHDFVEMTA